jgi:serine/alanine racemase
MNYPQHAGAYARVGIALYGLLSTEEDTDAWEGCLRPVLSLKARVACVRKLYAGEYAGYGMQFEAAKDTYVATVCIGYADGVPRSLSNGRGVALVHGRRVPIIGRICMDQLLLDVSGVPETRAGDEVVLIGGSGAERITAGEVAARCDTITNEILSRMGARVKKVMA